MTHPRSRKRALAVWVALGWVGAVGCDLSKGTSDTALTDLAPPPMTGEPVVPSEVYRQAYEQAREEITPDNAAEALRDIEGQVTRERNALR